MRKERGPLIHRLTKASKQVLEEEIQKAMDEHPIAKREKARREIEEEILKLLEDNKKSVEEKRDLKKRLAEQKE